MESLSGAHGHVSFGQGHSLFVGQQTTQYGGPVFYPNPFDLDLDEYLPYGYLPAGQLPQGYPRYPPELMYPGYGYPQNGNEGTPRAAVGQAACCGSLVACLTCFFCSCSPCITGESGGGGGGMRSENEADEERYQEPETANVSCPRENH